MSKGMSSNRGKAHRWAKEDGDLSTNERTEYVRNWYKTATYKPGSNTLLNSKYRALVNRSKKRGYSEWMTINEYADAIASGECFWCGADLPQGSHSVGLDRVNNNIGYVVDNVVPACAQCNVDRGTLSFQEYELVWRFRRNPSNANRILGQGFGAYASAKKSNGHTSRTYEMQECRELLAKRIEMREFGIHPDASPPPKPEYGEDLAMWRNRHSLSLDNAAYWLQVGRRTINRIEAGDGRWRPVQSHRANLKPRLNSYGRRDPYK